MLISISYIVCFLYDNLYLYTRFCSLGLVLHCPGNSVKRNHHLSYFFLHDLACFELGLYMDKSDLSLLVAEINIISVAALLHSDPLIVLALKLVEFLGNEMVLEKFLKFFGGHLIAPFLSCKKLCIIRTESRLKLLLDF